MTSTRRTYTGSPGSAGWIESGTSIEVIESGNGDRQVVAAVLIDSAGNSSIDDITAGVLTVDYEHHEIHEGDHYFVSAYQDLSINNVLQFTWQMPNTTKWIHWIWKVDTESETLLQVYEGGTITNPIANAITPFNNNRNSSNTSGTTMRYELHSNLAGADSDVDISGGTLIDSSISGSGRNTSGNASRGHELILKQNQLYVMRATATAAGYVNFNMEWYEHTSL